MDEKDEKKLDNYRSRVKIAFEFFKDGKNDAKSTIRSLRKIRKEVFIYLIIQNSDDISLKKLLELQKVLDDEKKKVKI